MTHHRNEVFSLIDPSGWKQAKIRHHDEPTAAAALSRCGPERREVFIGFTNRRVIIGHCADDVLLLRYLGRMNASAAGQSGGRATRFVLFSTYIVSTGRLQ
jgi:hypothetical protein